MIDVQINPFGRTLMTMALGVMKYQATVNQKNIESLTKEIDNIERLKADNELWNDQSFDLTSKMIDKRYTDSKLFIASGGGEANKSFKFRKSTTKSDQNLQYIVNQQSLKSRTRLNTSVSNYNKRLSEKKIKTSFKLVNLKQVL
jgi:acetylornithine/succinyldiaminopimelate/putrescine aminotransferase